MTVLCDLCKKPIEAPEQPHRYFSASEILLENLCSACCPRCWADRREADMKENG